MAPGILTHDLKLYDIAVAVAFDVAGNTGVISGLGPIHLSESQIVLLDYHAVFRVILNHVSLEQCAFAIRSKCRRNKVTVSRLASLLLFLLGDTIIIVIENSWLILVRLEQRSLIDEYSNLQKYRNKETGSREFTEHKIICNHCPSEIQGESSFAIDGFRWGRRGFYLIKWGFNIELINCYANDGEVGRFAYLQSILCGHRAII